MLPLRRFRLVVILLLGPLGILAAQVKYTGPADQSEISVQYEEDDLEGSISLAYFLAASVGVEDGDYIRIFLEQGFVPAVTGAPELPRISKLVEIPEGGDHMIQWEALDSMVISLEDDFPGQVIMPTQPSARKSLSEHAEFQEGYAGEEHPGLAGRDPVLSISPEGTMRGLHFGRLEFAPFRYDPGKNELTFYYNARFRIQFSGADFKEPSGSKPPGFETILRNVVQKPYSTELKRIISDRPITMVVLSDTLFRETLQPFVDWKKQKGFRIIEAYTSNAEVGNTDESIRAYMSGLYHDPPSGYAPPSYLLIIGDIEHVPISQSTGQVTDLYYTTFDGPDDYIPDMFHGRIAVNDTAELSNALDKILMYERYEFPDPSFLGRSILIAGNDGVYGPLHGNGQINYASSYYFNEANGILPSIYLHPEASSMDNTILDDIDNGAAMVNYTGHGEYYGWLDPAFRQHHVDTMKNIHKFGLMIGNGCSTNQFHLSSRDCFAETIIKAEDRGAVGYIGCTNDSYWDEDFYWSVGIGPFTANPSYEETTIGYYDKLFHQNNEPVEDWAPSLGEMIFAGNMAVQQSTSLRKKYYWEIYQLMGDPSLVPWFAVPANPETAYPGRIPENAETLNIRASAYDYVAISANGELIDAKHADGFGQVSFHLPQSLPGEALKLVVTGDHRQPLMDSIFRGGSRTGYLEILSHSLVDESVKEDEIVSQGEQFSLSLLLVNNGYQRFPGGSMVLSCSESFVEILDSIVEVPSIAPGDSTLIEKAFSIQAGYVGNDGASFILRMDRESGYDQNILFLKKQIQAPVLAGTGIIWEDRSFGNGNGIIESNERIRFAWAFSNSGSYSSDSLFLDTTAGTLQHFSELNYQKIRPVHPSENTVYIIDGRLIELYPEGEPIHIPFRISDNFTTISDSITLVTGRHFEDFSTGDLSQFNWMNSLQGWKADSVFYKGASFAFRSGDIGHNSSSSLSIEFLVQQSDSVCFDFAVSSETGYDYLRFYVNDTLVERWSGENAWEQFCHPLDSGQHMLEWRYQKDQNTVRGQDAAWVDNIIFPAHVFDSLDLGIGKLLSPTNSKSLSDSETVSFEVINAGRDTISGFSVDFKLGVNDWIEMTMSDTLVPGEKKIAEFSEYIDLSTVSDYLLYTRVRADRDSYPGNDSIAFMISHYHYADLAAMLLSIDSVSGSYADAVMDVTNLGNKPVEAFSYDLFIDNEYTRTDTIVQSLDPGENKDVNVRLLDNETYQSEHGMHQYLIALAPDSVLSNNTISGEIQWTVVPVLSNLLNEIKIYPNPTTEYFSIAIPGEISNHCRVEFMTISGEVVYSSELPSRQQKFRTGNVFPSGGTYVVRIIDVEKGNQYHAVILVLDR